MADESAYDPKKPNQHAQLLFDRVKDQGTLPELYAWLSRRNIDANVTPHAEILAAWAEEDA